MPSFAQPCFELTLPGAGQCPRAGPAGPWVPVCHVQREEAGWSHCPCPLASCVGLKDGPGFAFQNSKPDSLLKMEEEQKLEKPPPSGNKDTKFSFSFSNKKLLGYVMLVTGGVGPTCTTCHTHTPPTYPPLPPYITHVHAYTLHTSPHCTYTHISLTQLTHPPPCTHITNTYEGSPGKACFLSWLTSLGTPLVKATLGRPLPCLLSQRLVRVGSGEHSVLAGSESM